MSFAQKYVSYVPYYDQYLPISCLKEFAMTDNLIRVRVDEHLKADAASVLDSMGLSISDAVRILLTRVVADRVFPFQLKAPNAETIAAMEAAREDKNRKEVGTLTDLWTELEKESD
jgi:DNA-damage-inducible protein J